MERTVTGRPQRNRRHSRRAWPPEDDDHHQQRLVKRLFTPEIKRMLKDWLVRRRENPYPSRDEKKRLAIDTGLTYTQICNWFANWRRKLKNSERERNQKSWGHLIKHYNTNARGNVEQFSISSEDSIWEEDDLERDLSGSKRSDDDDDDDEYESQEDCISNSTEGTRSSSAGYASYTKSQQPKISCLIKNNKQQICYNQNWPISLNINGSAGNTTSYTNTNKLHSEQQKPLINDYTQIAQKPNSVNGNAKYKQKMMEKYLRDTNDTHLNGIIQKPASQNICFNELGKKQHVNESADVGVKNMHRSDNTALTKWLESAARFTPDKSNYFIEWNGRTGKLERKQRSKHLRRVTIIPANSSILHHHQHLNSCPTQLELEAAEALANMAFNCRQRMLDSNPAGGGSLQAVVNAISS